MKKVIKKHPLAIRWFHWINFPVLAVMIWSGLLIYWASDVYRLGWGDKTVLKFFPTSFYKALHVPFRLAEGMSLHFFFMWFFAVNGFIYVLYLIFSGEWRLIIPNRKSLKESFLVVLHDLHLRKAIPPQKKYNAAQRIAYTGVIVMGLGSLLTGLSIYKPIQFQTLCNLLGGYEWARAEHFILTILFTLFFVVHVIQVILAGWNNFQGMVTGLEVLPANKEIVVAPVSASTAKLYIQHGAENEELFEKEKKREQNVADAEILPGETPLIPANKPLNKDKKNERIPDDEIIPLPPKANTESQDQ